MRDLRWGVFLDRDGTINEEVGYLDDPERLRLLPGAAEAIRLLNRARAPVIVVTNQAGIGRGYFSANTVAAIHERLTELLASEEAHVDAIYFCPHSPEDGCACRKPKPGMVLDAAREHGIDAAQSFFVGDKAIDVEAGLAAGCTTVLVLSGPDEHNGAHAHHTAPGVLGAIQWILARTREAEVADV